MTILRPLRIAVFAATLLQALPACAGTTVEEAQALQGQLHDWLASLVAPLMPPDAQPVQVIPEGDGFRLRVESPLAADAFIPHGSAITLKATRLDGGRWALDDLTLPSPLTVTLPARPVPPAAAGAPPAAPVAPNTITFNAGNTSYHGVFDPSFATASHFESASVELRSTTKAALSETGSAASATDLQPLGNGRVALHVTSNTKDAHQRFMQTDGTPGDVAWSRSASKTNVDALSPSILADLIRAIAPLTAGAASPHLTPEQIELWNRAVADLFNVSGPISSDSEVSDITLRAANSVMAVDSLHVGTQLEVQHGAPTFTLRMGLNNLQIPTLPRGTMADLMPHDLTLALHIGGIPTANIRQILLDLPNDVGAPDAAQRQQAQMAALLEHGVDIGLDDIAFRLGSTAISGHALAHLTSPQKIDITADFAAQNLDTLLQRASHDPHMAQSMTALTIIRGLGKVEGTTTRWHIDVRDKIILVNGFDLRAFTARPSPAQPRPAAPASPTTPKPTPKPPAKP
ncbi:MAG: hypothetical protein P4L66_09885 [Acetobacteraceae bacterium]|nr:hypothetical protein [Acetobacteraceae bacterium]